MMAPGRKAQFNVAIRTVLVDKTTGEAEYGVGGGVVWDSTPSGEYQECMLKARILTEQCPEFSLLESLLWTPEEGYFLLDEHLRRLEQSARYFGYSYQAGDLGQRLAEMAGSLAAVPHKVRLLVSRTGAIAFEAATINDRDGRVPVRLTLASRPVDSTDRLLYHKTTHRAVYDAARAGAADGGRRSPLQRAGRDHRNVHRQRRGSTGQPSVDAFRRMWTPGRHLSRLADRAGRDSRDSDRP